MYQRLLRLLAFVIIVSGPAATRADGLGDMPDALAPMCDPAGAPVLAPSARVECTDAEVLARIEGVAGLADYEQYYGGLVAMGEGRVDDACELFDLASESVLPSLALKADIAHADCLVTKGPSREAQSAVRLLMTRYPGYEAAHELYRRLYPTRPAPETPYDERGRRRPEPSRAAPRARWTPPGPGDIADRMVGRANPRMHPVMRRVQAANLYMEAGRYADAWRFFNAIPARVLGREGAITAGMAALSAGEAEAALRILRPLGQSRDERAVYWAARAEQVAGNATEARELYQRLASSVPRGYYGVWAAARIEQLDGKRDGEMLTPIVLDGVPTRPAVPLPSIEQAMTIFASLIAEHGESLPWLARAKALLEHGLPVLASEELRTAHEAYRQAKGNRPRQTGILRLWRAGRTPPIPGSREVRRKRAQLTSEQERGIATIARAVGDEGLALRIERPNWGDLRNYHRQAWRDLVLAAAARHGLDPDLVWAIMFRESVFNSDVVSHARAIGLMQVIPPTGYEIAEARGIEGFDPSQLFDPERAIDFGAYYLRHLLDRFGGRVPLAIAGYNGGPHNVEKWLRMRGDADIDVFCEQIPFTETHRYVRRVMTSLGIFQSGSYGPGRPAAPLEEPPVVAQHVEVPAGYFPDL